MLANQTDLDALVAGLSTKSDKIRALAKAGLATADIARHLGIRYQHARNVLHDAALQQGGMAEEMPVLDSKLMLPVQTAGSGLLAVWGDLDSLGRLQIPLYMLAQAGASPGDRLFIKSTERGFEVFTKAGALARLKELADVNARPGVSIVDEFIEEKRLEVAADEAKWKRLEAEAAAAAKNV
jgi:hypothetical protein